MTKPVKVIVDTDIGPDCDDAAALALLHALADRGEAAIKGITHCTSSPYGASCIDAINRYCGRPDIPIGTLSEPDFLDNEKYRTFNRYIAKHYPNRFNEGEEVLEATYALRQWLMEEEDGSIVFIAIGPLRNLHNLLLSEADVISSLSGKELVERKVKELVIMGGAFPNGSEWNFEMCPLSAQYVVEYWPSPIMFTGFEIGYDILTGKSLFDVMPEENPVRKAYELFLGQSGARHSWDLTAILYGIRGLQQYWDAEEGGRVSVATDGANQWCNNELKMHRYLKRKMDPDKLAQLLDELLIEAGRR